MTSETVYYCTKIQTLGKTAFEPYILQFIKIVELTAKRISKFYKSLLLYYLQWKMGMSLDQTKPKKISTRCISMIKRTNLFKLSKVQGQAERQ